MQTIFIGLLFLSPALLLPGFGSQPDIPSSLTVQQAVELALAQNALVAAGEYRVQSAEGVGLQAGLKPNPRVAFQHENVRLWQRPGPVYLTDTDTFLTVSQSLETGGKRQLRVETAAAATGLARAEQQLLKRNITFRVASAFWAAVAAQSIPELLRAEQLHLTEMVRYTEARVKQGASPGTDLMRMQLEHQRVSLQISNARHDVARTYAKLFQEMGVPFQPRTRLVGELGSIAGIEMPAKEWVLEQRPEMQIARQAILRAEANSRLQQALRRADPDVVAGYKRTGGHDTLLLGVQINLNIRNRNQGMMEAAAADLRAARQQLLATAMQVEADVAAAAAEYKVRQAQVTMELPAMLERARESARIIGLAWKEGGVDLLRLLDARRAALEIELHYARTLAEYQQATLQLAITTGLKP